MGIFAADGDLLTRFPHRDFAAFYAELQQAVDTTFPGFGYSPAEIARFLGLNAEPYDDAHYVLRDGDRTLAVAMRCGDLLEYVVPAAWEDRYEAVARAIAALKAPHPALRIRIAEDVPSHSAWYAALLPGLGLAMTPRFRMAAPVATLLAHEPRALSAAYGLAAMESRWLEHCVALYLGAYGLRDAQAEAMAENLRDSIKAEDRLGSWTVALYGDDPVGSCFGSHHRGRLFVEELAVTEEHRQQGLGQALLLESVRRLARAFPQAETVVLDVDRMALPAVRLYRALGFSVQDRYTVAQSRP